MSNQLSKGTLRAASLTERPLAEAQAVYLVSCVSQKLNCKAKAKNLYCSPWFQKARAYAEAHGDRWYILSAMHGLLLPEDEVEPYEVTLNAMPRRDRRAWSDRVAAQIRQEVAKGTPLIVFAGRKYREFLLPAIADRVGKIEVPLSNLRIGEQLKWFSDQMQRLAHSPQRYSPHEDGGRQFYGTESARSPRRPQGEPREREGALAEKGIGRMRLSASMRF